MEKIQPVFRLAIQKMTPIKAAEPVKPALKFSASWVMNNE
jgi:hypothetical protein